MIWANFLHIYQPPTQRPSILKRVVEESYDRIIGELKKAPSAKVTMNVAGCLLDLLAEGGYQDTIEGLRGLMARGQLEMTLSAKYHPLLPKLSDSEVKRQIELDWETHKKYFGDDFQMGGFFPPEAAYTPHLAQIVGGLGFKWILAEELSYNGRFGAVRGDRIYEVEMAEVGGRRTEDGERKTENGSDRSSVFIKRSSVFGPPSSHLYIFFREREASFKILSGQLGTCRLFEDYLGGRLNRDDYLLTAMDGETFGHHRPGMEKLLFEIYKSARLKTVTASELIDLFPKREQVKTAPSTWALMEKDLERSAPFSRWHDPGNPIHQKQWQLTALAIAAVNNSQYLLKTENGKQKTEAGKQKTEGGQELSVGQKQWLKARQLLDRALHSDQYWWASARPWWSLEMIEAGAKELKDVVRAVPDATDEVKEKAEALYHEIITTGFGWQRSGEVETRARREDEEIRERTDHHLPKLPAEEIKKMIANIEREMLEVAERREYERAAQLRDRIRELEEYL